MNELNISNTSLIFATALVFIALLIDYNQKLGLGKDIFIAAFRTVLQLFIIGYVLSSIFKVNNWILTSTMVAFIIFNASYNAGKRAKHLNNGFKISLIAITLATLLSLSVLFFSGTLKWTPSQMVPITGMIASNAMTAVGVGFRTMNSKFMDQRQQVQEKISLGATPKQATLPIIKESIKTAMQPSIDSAKTVGLVSLPGMMSGLMFAGVEPTTAIRYQIVVMFMLISTTGFATMIASYLGYREYFNRFGQLK